MKYKNLYEITFEIKRGGWRKYMILIDAYNQKKAVQIAKEYWYKQSDAHMFSVRVRNVPLDEVIDIKHWFVKVA